MRKVVAYLIRLRSIYKMSVIAAMSKGNEAEECMPQPLIYAIA